MKKDKLLIIIVFILSIVIFNPIITNAWEAENVSVSNVVVREEQINSFVFHFEVPDDLYTTKSWLGLQGVKFNDSDLKDNGTIYGRYATINNLKRDDDFLWDYKIEEFSKEGFDCFGQGHSSLTETISDLRINSDASGTYYVYLWTEYDGSFYPDSLLAAITFNNGTVTITNADNEEIVNDTFENLEAPAVDKIEIDGVNLTLKVGERPTLSAKLKSDPNKFYIEETFMSTNRWSTISSNDDYSDNDGLIKDLIYYHICDIYIKDDVNLKFDENTKVYINGVEQSKDIMYVSNYWITVADEDNDTITPEGYIAPAYLDEDFEDEQQDLIYNILLEAAKAGGVKYDSDETKEAVNNALQNGGYLDFDFYASESITKSLASYYFEDEDINALNSKIGKNYKFAAYYQVLIGVYTDSYDGFVTELSTPVSITIPYPNGVPALKDGYKRVWKLFRYHNGKVDVLDVKKTENGMSFENDKFSVFALVYEDIKVKEDKNPATGDNIVIPTALLAIALVFTFVVVGKNRKKSFI